MWSRPDTKAHVVRALHQRTTLKLHPWRQQRDEGEGRRGRQDPPWQGTPRRPGAGPRAPTAPP